ncbi:MAG: MMPL family transporter [Bacteroidetes bacterium]|nr:MMPL family transporter [Bacteroidota bacterium]
MWERIAGFVLQFRLQLLIALLLATVFMGYHASKVQLSYDFTRAIPTNNPKYVAYEEFKKKFGDDGNMMVIGVQTDKLFDQSVFNDYISLTDEIKKINGVEGVISIPSAINLKKKDSSEKLKAVPIFPNKVLTQAEIDSCSQIFFKLPFYSGLIYNQQSHAYLMAISVNKEVINSAKRIKVIGDITGPCIEFGKKHGLEIYLSGPPLIRTNMALKVNMEMRWFLSGFVLLSALILLLFFRSVSTMLLSLAVVVIGVIFSLGTIELLGYKITLLNALIPPLIVVIGVPNCIYFLNKFHSSYNEKGDKRMALIEMIRKMGIVTLFCNIAAAIGFGVFALTKSVILQEFGIVTGLNIMLLFLISFVLIPIALSYLPVPKQKHMRYLSNKWLTAVLDRLEVWSLHHQKLIYGITLAVLVFSITGMFHLKSEAFIVDDLPKTDKIYTDLKFFEKNFKGVMPLEIVVDTKRKNGLKINPLQTFEKIDALSSYIAHQPSMGKPLSVVEGLKFVRQAYYDGDSSSYSVPNQFDIAFIAPYLNSRSTDSGAKKNALMRLISSFIDSNNQQTRLTVNMADVGTRKLPIILDSIEKKAASIFDSSKYKIELTGSSVTFLEGGVFIINGLKESIIWAFVLIAICMLYLFKSFKILLCSLIPNTIPLVITAGIMGWTGVPLKPSTVIVFSIALGIAIDITIRFLINYKQELAVNGSDERQTVINTIHSTGISIIYTSLVLVAGFAIFCFSNFGSIKALGWLTSLTLVMATLTNLIFLPALLITLAKKKKPKNAESEMRNA